MANASKNKGSKWERDICDFLHSYGIEAERIPAGATLDPGDIWTPRWTIEAKNCKSPSYGAWLDETTAEQANRGTPFHLLIAHRTGKAAVADGFAIMRTGQAAQLIKRTQDV